MRKILNFFKLCNLRIPRYIRQEFLRESVRKNDVSLRIVCALIFPMELFNIVRVLCWTSVGLGTRNNRIYFAMYCALIFIAVLWLMLQRPLQRRSVHSQFSAQYVVVHLIFLWHMCLNTYDLYRDPGAGATVLTTALFALALLIQMPPWHTLLQFGINFGIFLVMMAPMLDDGDRLNLTIAFVVALAVSLTHAHHTAVTLKQQKQILEMNVKLQQLAQLDPLTGLLNKITLKYQTQQVLSGLEDSGNSGGLTLLLLDLDKFKVINDHHGHLCGDHVLAETASVMRNVFPGAAGLGRIGGDEFAVLYDFPMPEEQVRALTQTLGEQLKNIRWEEKPLDVSCSVGACICTLAQCSYRQLYSEADQMLYRAKGTGRGLCCVCRLERTESERPENAYSGV